MSGTVPTAHPILPRSTPFQVDLRLILVDFNPGISSGGTRLKHPSTSSTGCDTPR